MKKFFTLIALFAISTCVVMAQNQILNGGFEDWGVDKDHTPTSGNVSNEISEPRYWHSFISASVAKTIDDLGLSYRIKNSNNQCFISTDAHSGNYSVCIKSAKLLGLVKANGTLTTGRLNAGSMTAKDPANHSELDMSNTATDRNDDPFYQVMTGRPDSIVFWVKYSTGAPGTKANMSAYITDGTYYQAPEDKTYENKVGWAENPNIAPCTEWTRISVPFTYADNEVEPKAILLTFSTSAIPGGGSDKDILYVDDVELIYKGDVNGDGNININDVVSLVNIILGNQNDYDIYKADVNGDKSININDVVTLVNRILGN